MAAMLIRSDLRLPIVHDRQIFFQNIGAPAETKKFLLHDLKTTHRFTAIK